MTREGVLSLALAVGLVVTIGAGVGSASATWLHGSPQHGHWDFVSISTTHCQTDSVLIDRLHASCDHQSGSGIWCWVTRKDNYVSCLTTASVGSVKSHHWSWGAAGPANHYMP